MSIIIKDNDGCTSMEIDNVIDTWYKVLCHAFKHNTTEPRAGELASFLLTNFSTITIGREIKHPAFGESTYKAMVGRVSSTPNTSNTLGYDYLNKHIELLLKAHKIKFIMIVIGYINHDLYPPIVCYDKRGEFVTLATFLEELTITEILLEYGMQVTKIYGRVNLTIIHRDSNKVTVDFIFPESFLPIVMEHGYTLGITNDSDVIVEQIVG